MIEDMEGSSQDDRDDVEDDVEEDCKDAKILQDSLGAIITHLAHRKGCSSKQGRRIER